MVHTTWERELKQRCV